MAPSMIHGGIMGIWWRIALSPKATNSIAGGNATGSITTGFPTL
jgi:hypothetical protein